MQFYKKGGVNVNQVRDLLIEYKATRRNVEEAKKEKELQLESTKNLLRKKKIQVAVIEEKEGYVANELLSELNELKLSISEFKMQKSALLSDLSNLNYAIKWMETARCPNAHRGVDNRSGYESNVTYNSEWVKHQSYQTQDIEIDEELEKEIAVDHKQKEKFARTITDTLTDRQKEVLQLSANGHNQMEISRLLNVSQQAVSQTIQRYEKKIKDEGWVMM